MQYYGLWVVLCLLLITAFVNSVVIVLFFVLKSFGGILLAVFVGLLVVILCLLIWCCFGWVLFCYVWCWFYGFDYG